MSNTTEAPEVGVIMGSRSDWETMRAAVEVFDELEEMFQSRYDDLCRDA